MLRAVEFRGSRLRILDQTLLPHRTVYLYPRSAAEVAGIIKRLAVRGAPAIGVAAAYGLAVEAKRLPDSKLEPGLRRAAEMLAASRPTAVNLKWAVVRVMQSVSVRAMSPDETRRAVLAEAQRTETEEVERSLAMARFGAKLLPKGANILTICNTGALAGPGMGTALGVVIQAHLDGKKPSVYSCETRPLLQGSRLTTLELLRARIPVTLIADSAAASVIDRCDLVLAGADRIAANGDTANKVGTRMLATLARAARKPFYIVAPTSTFDPVTSNGGKIVVEERGGEEVRSFLGCRAAPKDVPVFNPAFDVTPARLITGFITDRGIIHPPYRAAIRRLLGR
ncbi:S-methyl-5-thioribose-1-phosphate isomerase [candidate division WOR-3 bacterium]|uniref:Methylthioribose-1-phosphate isomerase n=1 Tax=candidate division WOR-3 bacterium TaxID=2052148 RepID=A0A937XII3_UNCW3|nr:S-methyl-5-thioribose-1-phosphate isomerase [candidate division WOR-3 bacterium]